MKKILISGMGVFMAAATASAAHADEERWPNWYLGLTGGYSIMGKEDVSGGTAARQMTVQDGYEAGAALGYLPAFNAPILNAMRFEFEVMYHDDEVHSVALTGGTSTPGRGSFSAVSYMGNAYYDLPLQSAWSPYIGAGIGMASVHLSTNSNVGNTNDSDNELAYQFMAGIGYTPVSIPNTQWTIGYRYFATDDPRFGGPTTDIKTQYSSNNIEAGVKFKF